MRDITLEDTFTFDFTTRQFSDGVPTVLAGSPVLSAKEGANATPITAGVSVAVDTAGVVGLNEGTVVATGANGFETGKSYSIYISTGTVGGVSVIGEVVHEFTIGLSAAVVAVALVHIGLVSPENGPAFPAEYAQVVAVALLASCVVPVRRRHGRGAYRPGSQLNGSALLPRSSDTVWFDLFRPHCWLLGARLCSLRGPPL
ncbi:MAG: hypothetical protein IIB61_02635 [Planctomycetes bacterium]|nr:hypothetical protein [Planctomycetota bacterium]